MSNITTTRKKNKQQANTLLPKLDKKAIKAFLQANPSIDLAEFNFSDSKCIQGLNWGQQEQAVLLSQLKALQRLIRLTHDLKTAEALYEHGLHAAVQIAAIPQHKFIKQYAALFKPNSTTSAEQAKQAKQVHKLAVARKSQAVLTYTAIAQHRSPYYRATRFDNLSAPTTSNYNNLPSYQDLFGDLDFCSCEDCRTIFSPAAYFVDLMRLQDNYIEKDPTANPPAQLLRDRRPDLWQLLLDCENTNTLISKLQIVNEVLLQTLGSNTTYQQLAITNYPFNLPFHLPLSQIHLYLGANNQSMAGICQQLLPTLDATNTLALARQSLRLSPEQWALYSTPQVDPARLALLYGLLATQDPVSTLTSIDAFLAQTGLSYVQLQELIYEDLSDQEISNGLSAAFFINSNVSNTAKGPIAMDTSKGQLINLTLERLDHINRFVRLAQALGWSFTDLDWALRTIGGIVNASNNGAPVIQDMALPYLAWIQTLQQQYTFSMNQSCALIGTVKDFGQKNGPDFFDQIFNNPYVLNAPNWKDNQGKYSLVWNVPQPASQNEPSEQDLQIQNALAAALQVSQDDLLRIAYLVLQALQITNNQLPLTLPNLSILYRLSQLPSLIGLSIAACFIALGLPGQPKQALNQLANVSGADAKGSLVLLTQFAQWLNKTNFSVYQLQFILTGNSQDATIKNQILGADKVINFLNEFHTAIQPTLFTEGQFSTALATLMQRSGSNTKAIQVVYNSLVVGNYIDGTSKVIKVPTTSEIQPIVTQIYPTNKPQDNPDLDVCMEQLGNNLIQLLSNYLGKVLSEDTFTYQAAPAFQNAMPLSCLLSPIWYVLQSNNQYVDQQGVITSFVEADSLNSLIQSLLFPYISSDLLENIQELITSVLQNTYQLQQKTLTKKLAALYGISPNLVPALEVWAGLTLGDLEAGQVRNLGKINPYAAVPLLQRLMSKPTKEWSKECLLQSDNQDIVQRLQLLQQYAVLLTSLDLSPADAQAMLDNPEYFGINYSQGEAAFPLPQFTLANIQTLRQFKHLVQGFQDTQNNLLNYFTLASASKDVQQIAQELSQITQWNAGQIQFLLQQLWPSGSNPSAPYATVNGVGQLQAYFKMAELLNLDMTSLWQLVKALTSTDYLAYQRIADALWGGLQKQYRGDQAGQLSILQGQLDEIKRSALLNLVMNHLRTQKGLPIATVRDLYEYLLIDVEVSGIVQTSYVKEAISAVQLYIYRCYNSLEPGIKIEETLNTWWPWLEQYRVWQANREVFLYPENYIQPELRHQKTSQFIQLENDLQENSLTSDVVDTATKAYLDNFAEVATLPIVGSYLYAHDANTPPNQQTLYLVGRTITKAYTYYYRTATFDFDPGSSTYAATRWSPWITIDLQIKSAFVSPVYAFDRLFLFWTETTPAAPDQDSTGKPTKQRFEATIYYVFYDFNQRWSAPQQLIDPILLPDNINTLATAEAAAWQQFKAAFVPTTQLLYWSWGEANTNSFYIGTLNDDLVVQLQNRYIQVENVAISSSPGAVVYQNKLYCFHQGIGSTSGLLRYSIFENGTWQQDRDVNGVRMLDSPSAIPFKFQLESQDDLMCIHENPDNLGTFSYSVLHANAWQQDQPMWPIFNCGAQGRPSTVAFQDAIYCFFWTGRRDKQLCYSYFYTDTNEIYWQVPEFLNQVGITDSPSAVVYQNSLYCFHQGDNNNGQLWYSVLVNGNWQRDTQVVGVTMSGGPSAVVYQDQLYCFYQGANNNGQLCYSILGKDGITWQHFKVPGKKMWGDPSVVVYQGKLYCFYQGRDDINNTGDGKLWYTDIWWPLSNRNLEFLGVVVATPPSVPPRVIPSIDLTWTIELGPDGTQFLAIPIQNSTNKQYIRLNSMVVRKLSRILFRDGMDRFLSIYTQQTSEVNIDGSNTPTLDFAGPNGLYYWEIFFHMPFLVAHSLSTQQQFSLAKKWYEYIFNPTMNKKDLIDNKEPDDKYWQFLCLRAQYNPTLRTELQQSFAAETQVDLQNAAQLAAYHDDPFDPHAIANLRPIAYQKTIVMHYINNLINWGDNLFRQYTTETLIEATMLYVMAYDLLGKQPINLGACPLPKPETLADIASKYSNSIGKIPEFLINVEQSQRSVVVANVQDNPNNYIPGDYFGLPENDQFTAYWDTVQQRLYNIRHSLTIDGIYKKIALFEPPINPMQLVTAIAAGEGIGQALVANQVDVPYYRFSVMVAKSQALAQTVTQLGQSLLTVLEKQDAEQLSLLYSTNQQNILALTRTSKQDQLEAATQNILSLQASLQNAKDRLDHYSELIEGGLSDKEKDQLRIEEDAINLQIRAQSIKGLAIASYLIPTVYGLAAGDFNPGDAVVQGAGIAEGFSNAYSMQSGLAGTMAGYDRRLEDWELQETLAQDDINQIQYQIVAAQYQEHMAQQDINLLEKQIEQEQAVQTFLKNKFTRAQLYQWMIGKFAALYFQTYQLAYDMAIQAEKAWQFERCKQQSFISFRYWEDLYHGLIAGEALQLDLQRMEKAYMDQDERKFEIEKIISLAQLDPQALEDLKSTGSCSFDLTERDFDYDYPGHYCRQIKSVSISFPALLGPYQNMHATLTQTASKLLLSPDANGVKYLLGKSTKQPDNSVLRVDMRANQQVALSQGLNDSGLFMLSFDDARYLPFEGTGAVSSWQLDMPKAYNPINFDSITNVIIRLQYTALSGGNAFQAIVKQNLGKFNGLRPLNMARDYASAWYIFIQQDNPLIFTMSPALFRPNLSNYMVSGVTIILVLTTAGQGIDVMPTLTLTPGQGISEDFELVKDATKGVATASKSGLNLPISSIATWQIAITTDEGKLMTAANVSNMVILLQYTADFS